MITHENPWLTKGETLICFGDSITEAEDGYVEMLESAMKPAGIKVVKAGRGGDTTCKALARLQHDVIDRKPAAVSIFLGTNDAGCGRGRWADEPNISPEAYRVNLIHMIYICRLAGMSKFSITPPLWRYEGESYAEFGDIFLPFTLAAREAADFSKVRFVPADTAFEKERVLQPDPNGLLFTTDGVHLSEMGNRLLAQTMLKAWGMDLNIPE